MPSDFNFAYDESDSLEDKIYKISTKIYHADGVIYSPEAKRELNRLQKAGYGNLPVCMAKTQYSFSDNPKLLGTPRDFKINVSQIKISAGAGFVVALTGDIMTMPGLPKKPSAENIDVDSIGKITGLF
jgi:formate--tetrahydrofolate ligase